MCPSQCPICAQHVYKLGHSLHTEATAWPPLVHWRCIHACAQAWAHVYISKQFPSLGTPTFTAVVIANGLACCMHYSMQCIQCSFAINLCNVLGKFSGLKHTYKDIFIRHHHDQNLFKKDTESVHRDILPQSVCACSTW